MRGLVWRWWSAELQSKAARKTQSPVRQRFGASMEVLEDRTVLSAPIPYSAPFEISGNQFDLPGNGVISNQAFLGDSFSVSNVQVDDVQTIPFFGDYGLQGNISLSGKVGFDAGYTVSAGGVSASYQNVTLNQNYVEPTQFGQEVDFTPSNTLVSSSAAT